MNKIKVALVGVGNCASSLVQGRYFYAGRKAPEGLMHERLGGYAIAITLWSELVGAAASSQPLIGVMAKLLAAAFLIWSAWKLWSRAGQHTAELFGRE